MPAVFRSRVKKLLDIDRAGFRGNEGLALAFSDEIPAGHGVDVPFTIFNAFMLGLALELWNAGFKQYDVVFLLRNIRDFLEAEFNGIFDTSKRSPRSSAPSRVRHGIPIVDNLIYLVLGRVELKETLSPSVKSKTKKTSRRTNMVVELTSLAFRLKHELENTPARRRGRPA